MTRRIQWALVILLPVVVIGGVSLLRRDVTVRNLELPTQMQYSPAYRSQTSNPVLPRGMTQQIPVAGTVPRGFLPFRYGSDESELERAGRELENPFHPTRENLQRGRRVYENFCSVCHGAGGAGDGPLIPTYPNPPAYDTESSRSLPDGALFHIITRGRRNMPPHATQLPHADRWKVILHIRRLQGVLPDDEP